MTVVRINAITVAPGQGDELARRFASRAGAVDQADGFMGFELLRPADERDTWLVVTRWRDEAAFQAWAQSPAFAHGHRGPEAGGGERTDPAARHRGDGGAAGHHSGDGGAAGHHGGSEAPPVAMHSELWSYDVVDLERGR